jgi:hypothetical protein
MQKCFSYPAESALWSLADKGTTQANYPLHVISLVKSSNTKNVFLPGERNQSQYRN